LLKQLFKREGKHPQFHKANEPRGYAYLAFLSWNKKTENEKNASRWIIQIEAFCVLCLNGFYLNY